MADFDRIDAALAAADEALAAYRDYAAAASTSRDDGHTAPRHRDATEDFDPATSAARIRDL